MAYNQRQVSKGKSEKPCLPTIGFAWVSIRLPNPGDVYPTDLARMPIVLVRDRQGTLRAFHNICSHWG